MSVTTQDCLDVFYGILRENESDSGSYDSTVAKALLNSAQLRITNGMVVNPLNGKVVRKGELPFLYTEAYFSHVSETYLTADTTIGATTLSAVTTGYPATGNLYIGGAIVTYTGITATTFTGCANVLFAFKSGTQLSIAYNTPTNFGCVLEVVYNNSFKLPSKNFNDIYEDLNKYKGGYGNTNFSTQGLSGPLGIGPFYTIKDSSYLIIYNTGNAGDMIKLRYERIPTELTTVSSTVIIPIDAYAKSTIPFLAVGEMLFNRGEEKRAGELLNFALGQIKEMYDFYNKQSYESISGKQYGIAKTGLNI